MSKRRFKDDAYKDAKDSSPPMSRLFVVCSKSTTEDELRDEFEKFGDVSEIWLLKDRSTKESKGVAYIKFNKTSEAAKAVEEMHGKTIGNNSRPIKVMVAANPNQHNANMPSSSSNSKKNQDCEEERYLRLFIIIPKDISEDSLKDEFGKFGDIDNVSIIRDRQTKEGKGFAYIKFRKFSGAALAYENSDQKYKAVFAEPRPSKSDGFNGSSGNSSFSSNSGGYNEERSSFGPYGSDQQIPQQNDCTLNVICSPLVNQDQLWKLFDIIPGLDYCQMNGDFDAVNHGATVVYNNPQSAVHARKKLHGFEYPPGERLIVKLSSEVRSFGNSGPSLGPPSLLEGMSAMIGAGNNGNSTMFTDNRDSFCSVKLPPPQPLSKDTTVAQRCFIVCTPHSLPINVLKQAFCRFGNLIDVYLLPNRNCGYVKYSKEESARQAMQILHGAEIYGVRLKVLEAEERNDQRKRTRPENMDE